MSRIPEILVGDWLTVPHLRKSTEYDFDPKTQTYKKIITEKIVNELWDVVGIDDDGIWIGDLAYGHEFHLSTVGGLNAVTKIDRPDSLMKAGWRTVWQKKEEATA